MSKLNEIFKKVGNILNKTITENDPPNKLQDKIHKNFELLENFFKHDFIKETFLYQKYYNEFKNIENDFQELFKTEDNAILKIAVVGSFSCGKSSFINSIVGEDITPVSINPTTHFITTFAYGNEIVIKNAKGEAITKEQYQTMVKNVKSEGNEEFYIYYPCEKLKSIEILDTPGTDSVEQDEKIRERDTKLSEKASKRADIIFYLFEMGEGTLNASSLENIKKIKQDGKNKELYIICNKSDQKALNERLRVYEDVKKLLEEEKIDVSGYLIYSSLPVEKQKKQSYKIYFSERKQELLKMLDEIVNNKSKILSYKNNLKMINIEHTFEDLISQIKQFIEKEINIEDIIESELYKEREEKEDEIYQCVYNTKNEIYEYLSGIYFLYIYDPGFMCDYRIKPYYPLQYDCISIYENYEIDMEALFDDTVLEGGFSEIDTGTWFEDKANEYLKFQNEQFLNMFKTKIDDKINDIKNELMNKLNKTMQKKKNNISNKYKKYIKDLKNILNEIKM